ncbi:hypothetical protein G3578_20015 [Brevibacillus sp. SYP-B805]|uniref:substrate-binding domain-containing protein n=1 Tax=Brevibacillus sp. SYP-B805 TaxID=1578199 RepID=UPI0013EB6E16|nr:substrate-binding domain-containing protein [Brevibacillus sp. SYP-B805]NGQ97428.1 hypothetical protein [Brevibacillus sp. SYP-B805]
MIRMLEIVEAVLDGRADAGILYVPPQHPDMEVIPLYEDDVRLVAHPSFSPAKQPLTAADLASLPLVYLDWGAPFPQWFEAEAGRQFLPGLQVDHASLLMRYLLDGGGIGFVLQSVCQRDVDAGRLQVVAYEPRVPVPRHTVYLVYLKRSGQQETVKAWSRFLQERVGQKESSRKQTSGS